jgi:predicted CxxxxCH...CXXCH cytochrome family protein
VVVDIGQANAKLRGVTAGPCSGVNCHSDKRPAMLAYVITQQSPQHSLPYNAVGSKMSHV